MWIGRGWCLEWCFWGSWFGSLWVLVRRGRGIGGFRGPEAGDGPEAVAEDLGVGEVVEAVGGMIRHRHIPGRSRQGPGKGGDRDSGRGLPEVPRLGTWLEIGEVGMIADITKVAACGEDAIPVAADGLLDLDHRVRARAHGTRARVLGLPVGDDLAKNRYSTCLIDTYLYNISYRWSRVSATVAILPPL
jgi:hypothetical protein